MHPNLLEVGGARLATHDFFTAVALVVGFAIYYRDLRGRGLLEQRIVLISLAALVGGAIGARVVLAWEHADYWTENLGRLPLTELIENSGKSLIGAIVGAWIAIRIAKRALGYRRSTGDSYAFALPIGVAIGRVGCFLSELPLGTPTDLPWGVTVDAAAASAFPFCPGCELPMHPTMLYEIVFNIVAVVALWRLKRHFVVQGDLIRAYLLAAAMFRFLVEFIRTSPPQAFGLTAPQWVLLPILIYLGFHFARSLATGVYRLPPAPVATSSPNY